MRDLHHPLHLRWALPALMLLVALPWAAQYWGASFYVGLASRILILGLAATSLNFILGFGGMVSFGHAAFVGVGAYAVGILMQHGVTSAWIAWPLAMVLGGFFALIIGSISLRTQGVYFIMITLAFAQMLYYLAVSIKAYGGDDGLTLVGRSTAPGLADLADDTHFYYACLGALVLTLALLARVLNARFGMALQAIQENAVRMTAIGYPVLRYQLLAFTLSGALAGLAGALLANLSAFVSPSMMQWSQSGMLMVMVILGGVGHLYGGIAGAAAFLILEEVLGHYTEHWQLGLGAVLLIVVLLAPRGFMHLLRRGSRA